MNPIALPSAATTTTHRVEFFRLPQPGRRDPYFGLSRGWFYKAASLGEIRMVSVRQRGALRGIRLVVYDSVIDYVRRSMGHIEPAGSQTHELPTDSGGQLTFLPASPRPKAAARA